MSGSVRLDKLLANMGYGSRREVQALARAGAITLDGAPVPKADTRIALTPDLPARMQVDGRPLDPLPGMALMLHKPTGVTCSHKETGELVYSLLPSRWRMREPPLSTVGRLDKETSGLLLLTDDGDLLHRIISPRRHVAKRYVATLARPLRGDEGAIFAAGELMLEGEDKPLAPAVLEPLSPTLARLTITEGRYHQVRRMFAAVGNHVEALHRDRIGGLDLPADLAPGRYRLMGAEDLAAIFA
ncbi:ribosomal small subunit pseudouridine synthase A [Phenylobacterium zucineum HLK1]|uniref:Pseudouridine synthase n=1 Tax=Phenylobacterium zucineum (strain HLK1) TaxID=450851 RepID=B4RFE0_PHEZH|nr:RNA pseudouridine synthase [Phenylobacterium zucineum]ACG78710.1 ribosomal small subunit pseudouridine synthase A [Phenylobacterium zucineum HLK1]